MPIRVTLDQVRAHTLSRQCLAPRRVQRGVLDVVRRVGPIRARPTTTPFLALWARVAAFQRRDLQHALYEERTLVRAGYVRGHLYVLPTADLACYHQVAASLEENAAGYLDYVAGAVRSNGNGDVLPSELIPRVLEVVNTRGECTVDELADWLPALAYRVTYDDEGDAGGFRLGSRLVPAMCSQGLLVRARPRGSWRSDLDTYTSLRAWLPGVRLDEVTPREALQRVLRLYLSAFGPATVGDMAYWLGGVRRHQVVSALMALDGELARVEIADAAGEAYLPREDLDALHAPPEWDDRLVRLLPPRDGLLMAYRDPGRILDPYYRDRVYGWAGESHGVVLVDGRVAGVWWLQSRTDRIVVRLLREVDPEAMALIGEEARDMGHFLGLAPIDVEIRPDRDESDSEALALLPVGTLPEH